MWGSGGGGGFRCRWVGAGISVGVGGGWGGRYSFEPSLSHSAIDHASLSSQGWGRGVRVAGSNGSKYLVTPGGSDRHE